MAYPGYEAYATADPYASYHGYAAAPMYGHAGYGAPSEELRTVFITGFPPDVKERELENTVRFLHGFEACQLNVKAGQIHGFALFHDGMSANNAMRMIAGLRFDEGVFLRAEMAHKNMYIRDDPAAKRSRMAGSYAAPAYGAAGGGGGGRPGGYAAGNKDKDNPPCNTLFVGNLGDNVDEGELRSLFGAQPGYVQLKVMRNGRNVTCFVEFDTLANATACHESQQGAVLTSSDRGGIRVQYSKNPFGKKRDHYGNMVDTRDFNQQAAADAGAGAGAGAEGAAAPQGHLAGAELAAAAAAGLADYAAQAQPAYEAGLPPGVA